MQEGRRGTPHTPQDQPSLPTQGPLFMERTPCLQQVLLQMLCNHPPSLGFSTLSPSPLAKVSAQVFAQKLPSFHAKLDKKIHTIFFFVVSGYFLNVELRYFELVLGYV